MEAFTTLKDILGTLIMRSNGMIIIKDSHRQAYGRLMQEHGVPPQVNIQNKRADGSIQCTLDWDFFKPEQIDPLSRERLIMALEVARTPVTAEAVEQWSEEQCQKAMDWAIAKSTEDSGVAVIVPPKPDFLPE